MATTYERLQTLAKEEYKKRVKELSMTEIEERLYQSQEYAQMSVEKKNQYLANRIFRPVMRQYLEEPKKWSDYIKKICGEMWDLNISVSEFDKEKMDRMVGPKNAVGELMEVSFLVNGAEYTKVYGYTECSKYGFDVVTKRDASINIVDLPTFFAGLYQYREIQNECRRLIALSTEEREKEPGYVRALESFQKYPILLTDDSKEGRSTYRQTCAEKVNEYKAKNKKKRFHYNAHYLISQCLSREEANTYFYCLFLQMINGEIPLLTYDDLIDYSLEKNMGWRAVTDLRSFAFLGDVLNARISARANLIANFNSYKGLDSDYAKSFMTKKNQSEKLKEQIKDSILQQYFGYVEYDEDVDVPAIRQYEKEFQEFYEKHLQGLDLSHNAIRFRKLGQHHAAGLYYPHVKCLCVDIHEPYSLIHELGHLIDYQFGSLSSKSEFLKIYEVARAYINDCMDSEGELAKLLKGKTKYNMKYYLTPTEVFARSYELYAAYILGEKSSLLKQKYEGVYDTSEENLKLIKEYFEENLKTK